MSEIVIDLTYKTIDGELHQRYMTPEEYFDPLEPDETYKKDGTARHFFLHQYVAVPASQLSWLELSIRGTQHDRQFTAHYFGNDREWLSHSRFSPENEELLILSTSINGGKLTVTLRKKGDDRRWAVESVTQFDDRDVDEINDLAVRRML